MWLSEKALGPFPNTKQTEEEPELNFGDRASENLNHIPVAMRSHQKVLNSNPSQQLDHRA